MTEISEELNQLFENLGIKNGDPLLLEDVPDEISGIDTKKGFCRGEEERCNSMNSDEVEVLAAEDLGTTPPRTKRNRKQRERSAYCWNAVAAAKTFCSRTKRSIASRCISLPINPTVLQDPNVIDNQQYWYKGSNREKKLSQVSHSPNDDQYKVFLEEYSEDVETSLAPFENKNEPSWRTDSLPPTLAVKNTAASRRGQYLAQYCPRVDTPFATVLSKRQVCPKTRYKCVLSKPFEGSTSTSLSGQESGFAAPELSDDRVSCLGRVIRLLDNNVQEPSLSYYTQRSDEEAMYQQEINEMIWLELQAWHAGLDRRLYDNLLMEKRQIVERSYEEFMSFKFKSNHRKSATCCLDIEDLKNSPDDTSDLFWVGVTNPRCSGCLSIWCDACRRCETEALDAVHDQLEKVDYVYSLFPSSRILKLCYPQFAEEEYVAKYKSLCLWFNIVTRLRFIILLLGERLGHTKNHSIPWPDFPPVNFVEPHSPTVSESKDSGRYSLDDNLEHRTLSPTVNVNPETKLKLHIQPPPTVTFQIDAETTDSSDPGQSTDSADLTESSACSTISSQSGSSLWGKSSNHLSPPIPVQGLRRCSSDIFLDANPFRKYVENLLRNKGMKKTLDKVAAVMKDVLSRTMTIIEASHAELPPREHSKLEAESKLSPHPSVAFHNEIILHGGWTGRFTSIGLPNIHSLCLFLASVPLHMMRECLKIRLSQQPQIPSRMSIRHLMTEYKEGIKFAVVIRQKFVEWCNVLVSDLPAPLAANLEARRNRSIEELDANVKRMLQVYLKWLDQLILMMHSETRVAGLQRDFLQEEWCFIQATCLHFADGESLAAIQFCNIACHMLGSVRDFLDTVLDDVVSDIQSSSLDSSKEEDTFDFEEEPLDSGEDAELNGYDDATCGKDLSRRNDLVSRCRWLGRAVCESRERALRAIALARMLKVDLEVAFEGRVPVVSKLFDVLKRTNHTLVKCHSLSNMLIFLPECLKQHPEEILPILLLQKGSHADKYLILMNWNDDWKDSFDGQTITLNLTAECIIALSRIQVNGVMVIAKDGLRLQNFRSCIVEQCEGAVTFSSDLIAPQSGVTQALIDMKREALQLCKCVDQTSSALAQLVDHDQLFSNHEDDNRQLSHLVKDTLNRGFLFGFEYHKEVLRLVSGSQREELAPMLIRFGRLWMKFVPLHYPRGKGCRPRWAIPGLDFLLLVCDPQNVAQLSDIEFKVLMEEVEQCRNYIIGSPSAPTPCSPSTPVLINKRFKSQSSTGSINQIDSPTSETAHSRIHLATKKPTDSDCSDSLSSSVKDHPIDRVRSAVECLEEQLEVYRRNQNFIGRVSEYNRDHIEIKPYTVPFSWHRGFKIGAGHFGKVYTAVNNNTGDFMAMKVIPLQPNDRRSVQRVVDELATFEKVDHPHLVRYYGVEIHSDEMLMFMEYCDEGTLDALASSSEGLPEEIVRKYTRQLLLAVHTLHENGIVHRDIKGANIFLANEGNILKLGDFGCAVRLRGLQTEANELCGIVGTHAFMAPEIFLSNEGHGRAADIWSVGCVVIEMVVGKRPWSQYDSSVQIMFQVGCGASPEVPDLLSDEGEDFLGHCFVHSPNERSSAAELLDHPFVKVEEDEVSSMPLFSLCSQKLSASIGTGLKSNY